MTSFAKLYGDPAPEADQIRVLPPPSEPLPVAHEFVATRFTGPDETLALRRWRDGWWCWTGPRWVEVEDGAIRSAAYRFTEHAVHERETKEGVERVPWAPNRRKVGDLLDALAALTHLDTATTMPAWLDGRTYSGLVVSVANGLLDVDRRELLGHDPRFFNATSVPFPYDPDAPGPDRWYRFLDELWGDDLASVRALAEWFGYTISGRLDMHKILLLVGPTRAGKGIISRILGALVGPENVAGPTLSSLNGDFGLAPLLGKTLAVVSDARLNGRGAHVVVERLLSISGEDTLTVNRKYRDQWTGKLPARLMLCSNELPHLGDASMAIAGRFVPLVLERSWYGREDTALERTLRGELPGILNWSLGGLESLTTRGEFTRSPVAAFMRDRCTTGADEQVYVDDLYAAFRDWADVNGHAKASKQVFGRDLRAAMAGRLRVVQPGSGDNRARAYEGIGLKANKASSS